MDATVQPMHAPSQARSDLGGRQHKCFSFTQNAASLLQLINFWYWAHTYTFLNHSEPVECLVPESLVMQLRVEVESKWPYKCPLSQLTCENATTFKTLNNTVTFNLRESLPPTIQILTSAGLYCFIFESKYFQLWSITQTWLSAPLCFEPGWGT